MEKKGRERGYLMLEATFCYVVCMIVIVLLLSVGFFLYQLVLVQVVTSEVAQEVAQNYKLRYVEDSSEVTEQDVITVGKYRYTLFQSSFDEEKQASVEKYAISRLGKTSLSIADSSPTVTIETVKDDIGRRHYTVTVSQPYTFLFGNILEMIGLKGSMELSGTACVQGTDMLNYINTIKLYRYLADGPIFDDMTGTKLVDTVINAMNSAWTAAKELLGN